MSNRRGPPLPRLSQPYRYRYGIDMSGLGTYRKSVREVALGNFGFVTTRDAAEAGVPPVELPKLAARGGLENVAYGVYRVTDFPPTVLDQFVEALLRVGEGAYLYGESVLSVVGLADVNPRTVKVAVARRARPKLPTYVELVRVPTTESTTRYEGLASQTVAEAILACRGRIEIERLLEAGKRARAEGFMTMAEWRRVWEALRS